MKKIIKKLGNSICITFTSDEKRIYEIEQGDTFDIELIKIKNEAHKWLSTPK